MKGTMSRAWRLALTLVLAFTMLGAVGTLTVQNSSAAWTNRETDSWDFGVNYAKTEGKLKWAEQGSQERAAFAGKAWLTRKGCLILTLSAGPTWDIAGSKTYTVCGDAGKKVEFQFYFTGSVLFWAEVNLAWQEKSGGRVTGADSHNMRFGGR